MPDPSIGRRSARKSRGSRCCADCAPKSGERPTERLFGAVVWLDVNEAIARRAGELGRAWRRSHQGIATADLIIAATAADLGHELATLNVKHFPMIPDLRPPYEP